MLPDHQSQGLGRALLERTLDYAGGGERGGIILASPDPRALRAYARAGFEAHPCFRASGRPRIDAPPPAVREGDEADLPLTEAVDRAVRGAPHGSDIAAMLRAGRRLLVHPERGYSVLSPQGVNLLAARDEEAARDLLLATLAAAPAGDEVHVDWITSRQALGGAGRARGRARAEARRRRLRARRRGAVHALPPERRVPVAATVSGP